MGFFPVLILLIVGIFAVLVLQQELMKNMTYYFENIYILSYFIGYDLFFFTAFNEKINITYWYIYSFFFFDVSYYLFFPETKGATRWIKLFNISLQPSEILKPVFLLLFLYYQDTNQKRIILSCKYFNFFTCFSYSTYTTDFGMFLLIASVWIIQALTLILIQEQ